MKKKACTPSRSVYCQSLPNSRKGNELPSDSDTIQDREMDIRFHDRTQYDVSVASY